MLHARWLLADVVLGAVEVLDLVSRVLLSRLEVQQHVFDLLPLLLLLRLVFERLVWLPGTAHGSRALGLSLHLSLLFLQRLIVHRQQVVLVLAVGWSAVGA